MDISLISNTGIQFYTLPEPVVFDLGEAQVKPQRYFEFEFGANTYIEPVLYVNSQFAKRSELVTRHYLDPSTNRFTLPEAEINMSLLPVVPMEKVLTCNSLMAYVGAAKKPGLDLLENRWLPIPYLLDATPGTAQGPLDWCRVMFSPIKEKCTEDKRVYNVTLAFDTAESKNASLQDGPTFEGQTEKHFSLCGVPEAVAGNASLSKSERNQLENVDVPLTVFSTCDATTNPTLNSCLQEIFDSVNIRELPAGQRLKFVVYYVYFVSTIHKMGFLPGVKLYNGSLFPAIKTNLVLDVGNSRTFGLLAEDPLNDSFSNTAVLHLRDLSTGRVYKEPFDMRLCFKEEHFGNENSERFPWPSVVRLGREALDSIYGGNRSLLDAQQYETTHSSPKRYLWDDAPFAGEWKFISEKDRVNGPAHSVYFPGLMEQLRSDGSFTPDPAEMGSRSAYSRASLMTLCFVEILLQARAQANSYEFRRHAGNEKNRRVISRVILTCPTAMTRREQLVLRRSMEEASVILRRYYAAAYMFPYEAQTDAQKIEVIPSVADLSLSMDNIDHRMSWNYDEATCAQMVYLYSQLRRNLGSTSEFFESYGRRRNGEQRPSLTIASLDIGAGTSDIMICNYRDEGLSVEARPLFYESFHIAGDDLVKRIITDVILESPKASYPDASGIITAKLLAMGCPDVPEKMHHFFGQTSNMGVVECRMRKEFCVQVLIPTAYYLLDLLQRGENERELPFDEIFSRNRPSQELLDFFAKSMGFRYEDLKLVYNPSYLNEIVRRVFELPLRKWSAIFYTFKADIVLLSGRPCSLAEIRSQMRRLMPVAPNHLISMADYRVGSWYPGSTDIGRFSDKKSLVAVGALIAYLASAGKLPMFNLNANLLKTKVFPTSEYIGPMNIHTGVVDNLITPKHNMADLKVSGLPVYLGTRQLDVTGYPTRVLYNLDFDREGLRSTAARAVIFSQGLAPDTPVEELPRELLQAQMEIAKVRALAHLPLEVSLERDYAADKEAVRLVSVTDAEGNLLDPNLFSLRLQSRAEEEAGWLDSGVFSLHLGI